MVSLSQLLQPFRRPFLSFVSLLTVGLAIALSLNFPATSQTTPTAPTHSATTPLAELRGVWMTNIDSDVLFSEKTLRRGIERLHTLNFNTIYPTVWNWGYTLYPSAIAKTVSGYALDPEPGLQGRDMLAEAIKEGHERGMAVIPWFEFGFMAPADSELARRHPDWITQRRDGNAVIMEGEHPRVWLNPFHPQVRQFIVAAIAEIVANYDVDGIQFDDHLGLPVELGYDPFTVALYQQDHQGKRPPEDENDEEWVRWRADGITAVTTDIYHTIKALKPTCLMSVAPNPQEFAYTRFLQDWKTWEERGLVDELIIQVYRSSMDSFQSELAAAPVQAAKQRLPVSIGILTGLKNRPVDISLIRQQVETARKSGFNGVSFFFYETLGQRDQDFAQLFANPTPRPATRSEENSAQR